MHLLSEFYNYNIYYDIYEAKLIETNLIELSNGAIAYTNKNGIIIYNKVNNKYILYKYIIFRGIYTIAQFTNDYFIIKDIDCLYKLQIKDYSIYKFGCDYTKSKSVEKIDKNTIIVYNGIRIGFSAEGFISFWDLNKFEIKYIINVEGIFLKIFHLTEDKFIISIYKEKYTYENIENNLGLFGIIKKGNKYYLNKEIEFKTNNKYKIINICPMKNGDIFYTIDDSDLYILTDRYPKK